MGKERERKELFRKAVKIAQIKKPLLANSRNWNKLSMRAKSLPLRGAQSDCQPLV